MITLTFYLQRLEILYSEVILFDTFDTLVQRDSSSNPFFLTGHHLFVTMRHDTVCKNRFELRKVTYAYCIPLFHTTQPRVEQVYV